MARVALVTGGTRGIGEAISIALAKAGCTVAANYAGNDERAADAEQLFQMHHNRTLRKTSHHGCRWNS